MERRSESVQVCRLTRSFAITEDAISLADIHHNRIHTKIQLTPEGNPIAYPAAQASHTSHATTTQIQQQSSHVASPLLPFLLHSRYQRRSQRLWNRLHHSIGKSKIESQFVEAQTLTANETQGESGTQAPLCPYNPDLEEDSELSSASVREKREFFEDAQKAEIEKTYVRKEPIAIPERLGPDLEEDAAENKNKGTDELPRADLSGLVNKFESSEEKMYSKKELIPLADQLHNYTEGTACNKEKVDILEQGMPSFDIQAIKNVFELGELSSSFREEREDQEEPESNLSETTADTSKRERAQETRGGSRQSTPLPLQKHEAEAVPAEPSAFSEAKSITEHFSNVDEFGNEVIGTRTAVIELSESASSQQVPFSYADVVKRKAAAARRTETYDEDATEKLLRNFHKTWTESETVFKSLGYSVSEETTAQVLSSETRIVSSGSSSEVGALHTVSEESLSNGCSDSGQKQSSSISNAERNSVTELVRRASERSRAYGRQGQATRQPRLHYHHVPPPPVLPLLIVEQQCRRMSERRQQHQDHKSEWDGDTDSCASDNDRSFPDASVRSSAAFRLLGAAIAARPVISYLSGSVAMQLLGLITDYRPMGHRGALSPLHPCGNAVTTPSEFRQQYDLFGRVRRRERSTSLQLGKQHLFDDMEEGDHTPTGGVSALPLEKMEKSSLVLNEKP
ncbi:unnamed protein product [Pleuronectes platessa]|uniref:Uncharacterized protein n=1 Tax=Pleuronectes platessa TaxID=8262 RepID=A0A9N7URL4_PLEPL|nr:unnamed protein product [Pleuronectes platessa]